MPHPPISRLLIRLTVAAPAALSLAPAAAQHDCGSAVAVTSLPFTHSMNTVIAPTSAGAGSCNSPGAIAADELQNALWYRITPAETIAVEISVQGAYDHICSLWTGPSCDARVEVACRDQPQPNVLHTTLLGGTSYWLSVGDFGTIPGGGPTTVHFDIDPDPLLNDECAGAVQVQLPFAAAIDTRNASAGPPAGTCNAAAAQDAGVLDNSVWYTLSAPATMDVEVAVQPESVWDPLVLVLRGGGCGSLTQIDCQDAAEAGLAETIRWTAQQGVRYWVVIGDRGTLDGGGPAQLTISSPLGACCLPDDSCAMLSGPACAAAGGLFHGDDSACTAPGYAAADGGCGAFEDIAATGTPLPLGEDDGATIPIGFSFPFFGHDFTDIGVSANGYLAFDAALGDFTNNPIPNVAAPNGLIAPLWTDLSPQLGGSVHHEVRGAPGVDQRLIVQWSQVPRFGQQDANTFQAVLFDNGDIEFRYGQVSPAPFPRACTIGVEDPEGEHGTAVDAAAIGPGQTCIALQATTIGVDCARICPCEFDALAGVTAFDLLAFMDEWFIASPRAEFDGAAGITVLDLLAYLQCWFRASGGSPCG